MISSKEAEKLSEILFHADSLISYNKILRIGVKEVILQVSVINNRQDAELFFNDIALEFHIDMSQYDSFIYYPAKYEFHEKFFIILTGRWSFFDKIKKYEKNYFVEPIFFSDILDSIASKKWSRKNRDKIYI